MPFASAYCSPPTWTEAAIEQQNGKSEHPILCQPVLSQLRFAPFTQAREMTREVDHVVELLPVVALLAPRRVVEVLATSGRVRADGLQMAVRVLADPDVRPCGRDRKRLDPLDLARPAAVVCAPSL